MHIDDQTYISKGKTYRRVLLRDSRRVNGKVCHNTIASLTKCSDEEINALKLALKHKGGLGELKNIQQDLTIEQGLCIGGVWVLDQLAKQLGIKKTLGSCKQAKLILWLIFSTLIEQGSRLSAVRLAKRHAACDVLGIEDGFNEDDLYVAMDWLEGKQKKIEDQLFKFRYGDKTPHFYLYDVTSSYFEGQQNELAAFGYNRDKKQGKMQLVIGLMTDDDGNPIAIEVFEGNTQDPKTVSNQIEKIANRFGVKKVTLVGDRGMIKSQQIKELNETHQFNYITAISKAQIEKLIKDGVMQYGLFDKEIVEIEHENIRYVIRRNPVRAEEIENTRQSKFARLNGLLDKKNEYLKAHQGAKIAVAEKAVINQAKRLKINGWIVVEADTDKRSIKVETDEARKKAASKFDGCYAIKTDLPTNEISTATIHDRYKGLAVVENAFRTMKTAFLEMRPIYVRKAERTRAHVFIVMLAYMIEHQLRKDWRDIDITVQEGIAELSSISSIKINTNNISYQTIPKPRNIGKTLLEKSGISLPTAIPITKAFVYTRKSLVSER